MDGPSKSYMLNKQIISQIKSLPLMFNTENKTKMYGYDKGWVSNELIQFRYRFL